MQYDQPAMQATSHPDNGLTPRHRTIDGFQRSDVAAAVAEFHAAFKLPRQAQPSVNVEKTVETLRVALLEEEVSELVTATRARDLVGIADALADITYVVYGTALTYGIDLDSVLSEVHRSNMSKLDRNGEPILRDDGKVLKPEGYSPPDIAAVLQRQVTIGKGDPTRA